MKHLLLASLMIVSISCKDKEDADSDTVPAVETPAVDNTATIIQSLQGTYSGCIPSPTYPGYYNKIEITITNATYDYYFELSGNASCTSPYYRFTSQFEISKADYETDGDLENLKVDFKVKLFKIRYNLAYYINQHYCGMNDWVLGVEKILTGVPCISLLSGYDAHHSSFKALDEMEYQKIILKAGSITIPFGYDQSGDSDADRKISHPAEIPKI